MTEKDGICIGEPEDKLFFQPIRVPAPVRVYDNYFSPFDLEYDLMGESVSDTTRVSIPENTCKTWGEVS